MEAKFIKPTSLYNKLQDLRHLIVLDYREGEAFAQSHIRNSINLSAQTPEGEIQEIVYQYEKKFTQSEEKYKTKRIRRIVLVGGTVLGGDSGVVKGWVKEISSDKELEGYQLMVLNQDYEVFRSRYPYLCIANKEVYGDKLAEDEKSKSVNLSEYERKMLYAMSKFPTEIVQGEIYIGDIWNSNNQEQLKDLNIKTIIDFVGYNQEETVPEFKNSYNYIPMPMNSKAQINVDFDGINRLIEETLADSKGPILMHCRDGNQFAPAFAIAYLMYHDNKPFQFSSLKVFQALSSTDICKWIYTQITIYSPKKIG